MTSETGYLTNSSADAQGAETVDVQDYREIMGSFATGVTVVTTSIDGRRYAMTANSLTSVSLRPLLLLVCFKSDSLTGQAVRASGRFAISILGDGQASLAQRLAKRATDHSDQLQGEGVEQFRGIPVLRNAIGWIACRVYHLVPGGDHDIVISSVEGVASPPRSSEDSKPLIFYRGGFKTLESL